MAPQPAAAAAAGEENAENVERSEIDGANAEQPAGQEAEPLVQPSAPEEPEVPLLTIVRTFVLSFFSSIIPESPALWVTIALFANTFMLVFLSILWLQEYNRVSS